MKTKIVYVITSDSNDPFLEQLYLSMVSLKKYTPQAFIVLAMDNDTQESLIGNRKLIGDFADQIIPVKTPDIYNKMQRSRYIKTSLRNLINGDFLYIDSDTIICGDLSEIDNMKYPLMAVPDFHSSIEKHPAFHTLQKFCETNNISLENHRYWYNGGLIYVKDEPIAHEFYDNWNREWKRHVELGCPTDQQSLLFANGECGFPIKCLDPIWNCQVLYNGLKYLSEAKIIHYFASGLNNSSNIEQPYIFQNKSHYEYIKKYGELDELCLTHMNNPRGAFVDDVQITTSFQSDYLNTPFYSITRNFYYSHPKVIKLFSKIKKLLKR